MNLIDYIKKEYDQNFDERLFPFPLKRRKVEKNTIIYPYDKYGKKMYFLNEGIVETTIKTADIEKTLSFTFSDNFFGPLPSILSKSKSDLQGIAITDSTLEEFHYEDYIIACKTSLLANNVGRKEIEKYSLKKLQRERNFLTKTTEEMYIDLVNDNPEILHEIPLKKIANYLGVLPETLSRIRKKIIS